MKPNFALSLSFEGITLLHRAAGGWREVGAVKVASDDLAGELATLRKTASGLAPGGVRSKLLIPDDQIKYLTMDTPGMTRPARLKAAQSALENATPYAVEDLAFDISQDGPRTHVAAVARETLAEAEAFAVEHRFHPVSFVGVPQDADYLGEPFFGTTEAAVDLLERGEEVEPDGIAVVVIGSTQTADAVNHPVADEVPDPPVAPMEPPTPIAVNTGKTKVREKNARPAATTSASNDDIASQETPLSPDLPPVTDPPPQAAKPDVEDSTPKTPRPDIKTTAYDTPTAADGPTELKRPKVTGVSKSNVPPAPLAPHPGEPRKPNLSSTRRINLAPASVPEVETGFTSRRGTQPALGGASRSAPEPDSSSLDQPPAPTAPVEKTGFLSRRKPRTGAAAPVPAPATAVSPVSSEAERMTVFGARSDGVGGKPRFLGLIMTVILLVFLAGVAAWAAVFLDDGLAGLLRNDEPRTTASAPENQKDPEIMRQSEREAADEEPQNTPATPPDDLQAAAIDPVLLAEEAPSQRPRAQVVDRPAITRQSAAARYAVSGIWPLAPEALPTRPQVDDAPVFRNGIDGLSTATDAIALPEPDSYNTDVVLAAVPSPPPFGQTTRTDDNGLLVPTEDGVVTPQGYTLIAASPPIKPPLSATRFSGTAQDDGTQERTAPETAAPEVQPVALRPRSRPGDLVEETERAQLGGITRLELAAFRPTVRPRSVQERAKEAEPEGNDARARAAAEAASAAAAAALALPREETAAAAPVLDNATRLATAESIRPDIRPGNFGRIVQRAKRAAPQEETRVAAVAPRTVAPKLPSSASVTRSATVKNAINLRRVNLIGVYGKPSSRRALVRLSNGRYRKVQVGDRIDGGRVSAIGDADLRYQRGGRNIVLKMPSG